MLAQMGKNASEVVLDIDHARGRRGGFDGNGWQSGTMLGRESCTNYAANGIEERAEARGCLSAGVDPRIRHARGQLTAAQQTGTSLVIVMPRGKRVSGGSR